MAKRLRGGQWREGVGGTEGEGGRGDCGGGGEGDWREGGGSYSLGAVVENILGKERKRTRGDRKKQGISYLTYK